MRTYRIRKTVPNFYLLGERLKESNGSVVTQMVGGGGGLGNGRGGGGGKGAPEHWSPPSDIIQARGK